MSNNEHTDLLGRWSNDRVEITIVRNMMGRMPSGQQLLGNLWEAIQRDSVFGDQYIYVTPAGLQDCGYKRVEESS